MLNPDGVVNGNYRCSLAGVDLNRQWHAPIKQEHPTVYALKMLLRSLQCQAPGVALYCDIHGHSRHKGTFMYGLRYCTLTAFSLAPSPCSPAEAL